MRYVLAGNTVTNDAKPPAGANRLGLLMLDAQGPAPPSYPPINDKPHIKYEWTVGKRTKFSCTVYFARQFDSLRRKCGIEEIMLKSLERSDVWDAEGGKSRSNFFKSSDDRFIIKTLVNAWNVADLQVLLEIAPAYFEHIESTAKKPSVLAKVLGFFTVEVKNFETGQSHKSDLIVMENLFANMSISKTFDLKGIQTRKVKPGKGKPGKTMFDGEWIEGQQRSPIYITAYSKPVLHEAVKHDVDFLAKSNIMDYSLLLGVDEEKHQIACGLVDTIGSYTFAKTLEYKAKQGLNSAGKEITVIPPAEYQERFVTAMESYFIARPDKWTKPLGGSSVEISTVYDLPSVL
jgi:1-phosphatidylinositol-3-phosphate 5-kinase